MSKDVESFYSTSYGVIVVAIYKPDRELLLRQLRSLQEQTHKNFDCLIGADGDEEIIREVLLEYFFDDPRFKLVGFDNNVGFYRNFERLLEQVPGSAEWISLSDQDDYWYPHKIATLLPYLDNNSLISGQARIVSHLDNKVISESTSRKNTNFTTLIINNQFTGCFCIFRRELLDIALPFPKLHPTRQYHDHWLAICAYIQQKPKVVDIVLQDYVQHSSNVVGEATHRIDIYNAPSRISDRARKVENSSSLASIFRMFYKEFWGFYQSVATALSERSSKYVTEEQKEYLNKIAKSKYSLEMAATILYGKYIEKRFIIILIAVSCIPGGLLTKNKKDNDQI